MSPYQTKISYLLFAFILNSSVLIKNVTANDINPFGDLAKTLFNFTNGASELKKVFEGPTDLFKDPASILTAPAETLSKLLTAPVSLTGKGLSKASDSIEKVANQTSKAVDKAINILPGVGDSGGHSFADDYEDLRLEEMGLDALRRPRYYSRDCEFRIACELGLKVKPMTIKSLAETLKSKMINNLHNRYTRAFSYGLLNEDCRPYYCLLVQFFGGPKQMAKGIAELMNKIANPELYD